MEHLPFKGNAARGLQQANHVELGLGAGFFPGFSTWGCNRMTGYTSQGGIYVVVCSLAAVRSLLGFNPHPPTGAWKNLCLDEHGAVHTSHVVRHCAACDRVTILIHLARLDSLCEFRLTDVA
jgi:hypothetical protein